MYIPNNLKDKRIINGRVVGELPKMPLCFILTQAVSQPGGKNLIIVHQDVSHSAVANFLLHLEAMVVSIGKTLKDTSNTDYNFAQPVGDIPTLVMTAGAGNTLYGVVVGIGNVAPVPANYALGNIITHGVAAGQLQYGITNFTVTVIVGQVSSFTVWRNFTNASGGVVSPTEAGLIFIQKIGATNRYFLGVRDTFAAIAVNNGQVLTETYTIQITT